MPFPFPIRLFQHWLGQRQLTHPLILEKRTQRGIWFRFRGITPAIQGRLSRSGSLEIYALHGDDESFWDILIDFDLAEVRLPDAYYACAFCRDHLGDKAGLYENREELWIQHSFNPLAEWSEKYLKEGCYLCLYGMKSGATWAKIENDKNPRDYLLQAIPILVDCALQ